MSSAGGRSSAGLRVIALGLVLLVVAFVVSRGIVITRFEYAIGAAFGIAVFVMVFLRTEAGLYLVLLSMLLSPEFGLGRPGALAEDRTVIVRLEDFLLIVIAFGWLAKMAVYKDIGLTVRTSLNRPIVTYTVVTFVATLLGYLTGTVKTAAGFFYVLKYVEYFVVYYMTINYLRDRSQAWRLIMTAFATAAIVSLHGVSQIPSGQRVSAPFEGEVGEPNSFGGYLLLMMGLVAGIALETRSLRTRLVSVGLLVLMGAPFIFTLSRASYLGVIPLVATLTVLSTRRKFMIATCVLIAVASPLLLTRTPEVVVKRVRYTFEPQREQATVRLGGIAFDPSTSERLIAMRNAVEGWVARPLLGYGVTGFRFMDAQYARTLAETGLAGLLALLWLLWAVYRSGLRAFRSARDGDDRGLALGFVAGTAGLLAHAVGSNTFIIIRIMEPFWFFAGIMALMPVLEDPAAKRTVAEPPVAFARPPVGPRGPRLRPLLPPIPPRA